MEAGRPVSLLKKGVDDLKETWPGEPDRFLEHHIDPFLLWCVKKNSSDITFQSNRAVMCEIYGSLYPSTYRSLDAADMTAAITRLYGTEALAILAGGADIDLSYEIMIDRFTRTRFRVNMTAILADGRDGCQITMRVLPQAPPTFTQLKIEEAIVKNWRPRHRSGHRPHRLGQIHAARGRHPGPHRKRARLRQAAHLRSADRIHLRYDHFAQVADRADRNPAPPADLRRRGP
jgi:hypothetical protein